MNVIDTVARPVFVLWDTSVAQQTEVPSVRQVLFRGPGSCGFMLVVLLELLARRTAYATFRPRRRLRYRSQLRCPSCSERAFLTRRPSFHSHVESIRPREIRSVPESSVDVDLRQGSPRQLPFLVGDLVVVVRALREHHPAAPTEIDIEDRKHRQVPDDLSVLG